MIHVLRGELVSNIGAWKWQTLFKCLFVSDAKRKSCSALIVQNHFFNKEAKLLIPRLWHVVWLKTRQPTTRVLNFSNLKTNNIVIKHCIKSHLQSVTGPDVKKLVCAPFESWWSHGVYRQRVLASIRVWCRTYATWCSNTRWLTFLNKGGIPHFLESTLIYCHFDSQGGKRFVSFSRQLRW